MPIVSSEIISAEPQATGVRITERHVDHRGMAYTATYLADSGLDIYLVLTERANRIGAEIDAREMSQAEATNFEVPLTKYQFRQLFTQVEREACDEFNAAFESNASLTAGQKSKIRTGLKDFEASGAVYLSNPAVLELLLLYEAVGKLAAGRAAQIVSGVAA